MIVRVTNLTLLVLTLPGLGELRPRTSGVFSCSDEEEARVQEMLELNVTGGKARVEYLPSSEDVVDVVLPYTDPEVGEPVAVGNAVIRSMDTVALPGDASRSEPVLGVVIHKSATHVTVRRRGLVSGVTFIMSTGENGPVAAMESGGLSRVEGDAAYWLIGNVVEGSGTSGMESTIFVNCMPPTFIPAAGACAAQGAIDEIVERVEALEGAPAPASKVTFDPAGTGLAATTVQAAIAEVNAAIVNDIEELEDRVAALEGAPSNLGGALAASWSPSIDINSINGGSLTLDA